MIKIRKFHYLNKKHFLFVIKGEKTFIPTHGEEAVWFPVDLKNNQQNKTFNIYVAEKYNHPVAYVMFDLYSEEDDGLMHLETIYTDKRFRGQGIMKKLLKESLNDIYRRFPDLNEIHAENLIDDKPSDKSLFSSGFEIHSIDLEMYDGKGGKKLIHRR